MRQTITLPIYWETKSKRSAKRGTLLGLNWYRNAHYRVLGQTKNEFKVYVRNMAKGKTGTIGTFRLHYDVYVANLITDGPNVRAVIEKFATDALLREIKKINNQTVVLYEGILREDNVQYLKGDSANYYLDKKNPRCEMTIIFE